MIRCDEADCRQPKAGDPGGGYEGEIHEGFSVGI